MAGTNDFKAFATDANANVTSQEEWETLTALKKGFSSGKASSAQVSKALRQPSTMAAVLGQFIANAELDALDDGDVDGLVAKLATAITTNLGLGEAAKRDVGTGENQIPDMVSFSGVRDFYGKQLLPGGLILQWLTIPSSAAVKAVTLDNGNYQLSGYKWPQSFGVLFAVFATKVSGSTNEAYAISVNRHSTDVIVTWNARKADDVHILGIGKL
ncbi:phage tail protein [Escherichia coli]|uniref:phage tail protein n=1 Tax=Escherichia coli TaxID=562 RepID=UPI0017C1FB07|nr:phage tail protein [Escherichia coli]EFB9729888.1 phage tail protein [Escherichia coli]EFC2145275.1 phage tail protein [Escherichia coli]EFM0070272.1 phage tail protein [Escherichia coli]MCG8267029.1 phage tail protein [Escherichia coli]MCG8288360.1 phage tail protein [Escherichia coli]